ncbi:MAG: oxygen-dependent coproporphyrinogen oxidase [Rickettsia sp.]|nr:oxygen-dependent coproporphyrinogen oxidase [Rickettsia sp.]
MLKESEIISWFRHIRDLIIENYIKIEKNSLVEKNKHFRIKNKDPKFKITKWSHKDKGGGEYAILKGNIFEKIGVNISQIETIFSKDIENKISFAHAGEKIFATGISLVSHMCSPFIPAIHFNTRYIKTKNREWFGGGIDLTPIYPLQEETENFHKELENLCNLYDSSYYKKFKKNCDEYFFLKHRNEARGIGGIFFDYLDPSLERNFYFIQDLGKLMLSLYPKIISQKINIPWSKKEREYQLIKRGKYVEFNLLYDRGTRFGLETGGNIDAIFISLPPKVKWI